MDCIIGDSATAAFLPSIHPAAAIFPLLSDNELNELAEDIRQFGQRDPCIMYDGKLLDGRNRWLACNRVGITPRTSEWDGQGGSPTAFVISVNLRRRHLDASQRAMAAGRAKPLFEDEARERQLSGLKQGTETPVRAKLPERDRSRDQAAEVFHVSGRDIILVLTAKTANVFLVSHHL